MPRRVVRSLCTTSALPPHPLTLSVAPRDVPRPGERSLRTVRGDTVYRVVGQTATPLHRRTPAAQTRPPPREAARTMSARHCACVCAIGKLTQQQQSASVRAAHRGEARGARAETRLSIGFSPRTSNAQAFTAAVRRSCSMKYVVVTGGTCPSALRTTPCTQQAAKQPLQCPPSREVKRPCSSRRCNLCGACAYDSKESILGACVPSASMPLDPPRRDSNQGGAPQRCGSDTQHECAEGTRAGR